MGTHHPHAEAPGREIGRALLRAMSYWTSSTLSLLGW